MGINQSTRERIKCKENYTGKEQRMEVKHPLYFYICIYFMHHISTVNLQTLREKILLRKCSEVTK